MERITINPWTWQDQFGYAQAFEVKNATSTLVVAGQTAVDADGHPMHPGDMRAQANLALDNVETVLHQAGYTLADVVRLSYYTIDVDALLGVFDSLGARLGAAGCAAPGVLIGVQRLAFADLMVEIEVTAMK